MVEHNPNRPTRPSLLVRLPDQSDKEAWITFDDIYRPMIYRYCVRKGLSAHDADEVTQNVLMRVSQKIHEFEYDPARGKFRGWLYTIACREISRFAAKQDGRLRGIGGSDAMNLMKNVEARVEDNIWNEEFTKRIWEEAEARTRNRVEETTWQAFVRTWQHNRSSAEVAEELNIGIDKVYVAKSRVLALLREIVAEIADQVRFDPD